MPDAYTPQTSNGSIFARAELDLIATASAALEARIVANEARPAYSGMRIDSDKALSLSTTPLEIIGWDAPNALAAQQGVTRDISAGALTIAADGVYLVDLVLFLTGIGNTITYVADIHINHQPTGGISGSAPEKNTDQVDLSVYSQPVALVAGDELSLYISASAASSVTLGRAMMRAYRIG